MIVAIAATRMPPRPIVSETVVSVEIIMFGAGIFLETLPASRAHVINCLALSRDDTRFSMNSSINQIKFEDRGT